MTKEEFGKIAVIMKTCYPKESELLKTEHAVGIWYELLKDIDYTTMSMALNKWVATEKWSPSISELRKMCYEVSTPSVLPWDEAWESVLQAVRNYGFNRRVEAMDTLDDLTRKAVAKVGWMQICHSEQIGIERASFREIYNAMANRQTKDGQTSPAVRKVIEASQNAHRAVLEDKGIDSISVSTKSNIIESGGCSDRIQKLINKTKESLRGVS